MDWSLNLVVEHPAPPTYNSASWFPTLAKYGFLAWLSGIKMSNVTIGFINDIPQTTHFKGELYSSKGMCIHINMSYIRHDIHATNMILLSCIYMLYDMVKLKHYKSPWFPGTFGTIAVSPFWGMIASGVAYSKHALQFAKGNVEPWFGTGFCPTDLICCHSPLISPPSRGIYFQLAKIHKDSPCQWLNLTYCTVQFINSFFVHNHPSVKQLVVRYLK